MLFLFLLSAERSLFSPAYARKKQQTAQVRLMDAEEEASRRAEEGEA